MRCPSPGNIIRPAPKRFRENTQNVYGNDKAILMTLLYQIKGCGMGPWLVLVSPCFRENVVATCKLASFLCSLDNLLQKNVIILFFGNQISKWRSFEKRGYI